MKTKLGRRGTSLVEVVVAMLIVGLLSALCMPIFLTGRLSEGRAERRAAAADVAHRLSEELKAYVTADPSLAPGPGGGVDGWSLPGDTSGRRALAAGPHPLNSALWAGRLAEFRPNISYTVEVRRSPSGPQPDVVIQVEWQEPQ